LEFITSEVINILFLQIFQKLKILKDNWRNREKPQLSITYGNLWICLKFLKKSRRVKCMYLRLVISRHINNLNENGKIKIVQKKIARKLKLQFIRFDTFCRMS